jgi:hypothetical protein
MDRKPKVDKLTISQVAAQEILKAVDAERIYTLETHAELITKRIEGDLTLLGVDISQIGRDAAQSFAENHRPNFHQQDEEQQTAFPFYWYQPESIIPIDENGTQVFLAWCTMEHWTAYKTIRNKKLKQFQDAEAGFRAADAFMTMNMLGHVHLKDLMGEQGF